MCGQSSSRGTRSSWQADGFTARIARDGSIDSTFAGAIPQESIVYDVVTQPDGSVTVSGAVSLHFG